MRSAIVMSACVGVVPEFAGRDAKIDDAAGHRRHHRHRARLVGGGIDADLLEMRRGALILGLGGDVVGLRLLQVLLRRAADLRKAALPIAVLAATAPATPWRGRSRNRQRRDRASR